MRRKILSVGSPGSFAWNSFGFTPPQHWLARVPQPPSELSFSNSTYPHTLPHTSCILGRGSHRKRSVSPSVTGQPSSGEVMYHPSGSVRLNLLELRDASRIHPLGHINVAVGIKASVMWMNKLPIVPFRFIAANRKSFVIHDTLLVIPQSR